MNLFWWNGRRLRTVWRVERGERSSFLVGTAHFSPYRFEKALLKLIQCAGTVLFEGPLDKESMARVVQYGRQGESTPSLYEALDPGVRKEINKQLSSRMGSSTMAGSYVDLFHPASSNYLEVLSQGVRPWMAFFAIWSTLLNWKYSMDMEAFHLAQRLGKRIRFLETIEDQLAAMDGIPFERFVNYLNHIERWEGYKELFQRAFLAGELEKFSSMTGEFPTRCESIITKRDPLFFQGIKAAFEEGKTVAFVGVAHVPGIRTLFLDKGYQVTQEES
jgi:uncharacterized protein YbaP (TraB family)